jgi:hypothetical protein
MSVVPEQEREAELPERLDAKAKTDVGTGRISGPPRRRRLA